MPPRVNIGSARGAQVRTQEQRRSTSNSCSLKCEGVEPSYLANSIILWIPTKFVHYDVPGVKTEPAPGSQVRTEEQKRPTLELFLSETGTITALMIGT